MIEIALCVLFGLLSGVAMWAWYSRRPAPFIEDPVPEEAKPETVLRYCKGFRCGRAFFVVKGVGRYSDYCCEEHRRKAKNRSKRRAKAIRKAIQMEMSL